MLTTILTILGLAAFESVSSVDNAVINAEVLKGVGPKAKKWFLTWGMVFAVFGVRGLLPWLIIWAVAPQLGPIGALTATFRSDPAVLAQLEEATPVLLAAGGTFLVLLFLHWLFVEPKTYGLRIEAAIHRQAPWFYASASLVLLGLLWVFEFIDVHRAIAIAVGSSLFFITHGIKESAEQVERDLLATHSRKSDWGKIIYLELIDAIFSIDGVLGSFAFTRSVPLILLGNGLGALIIRQLTVSGSAVIAQYPLLKNGAMYAVALLGGTMLLEAYGAHVPLAVAPLCTIGCILLFLRKKA